jgi:hypothetical protein
MSKRPSVIPSNAWIVMFGVLYLSLSPTVFGASWQWPVPEEALESSSLLTDTASPWWSVSGVAGELAPPDRSYRFAATGTVLYHITESPGVGSVHSVPRSGDLVVLKHDDGFWTLYSGENLRLSGSSWSAGDTVGTDSRFFAEGDIAFAVFDAVRNVFVNPRAVLPERSGIPDDSLPVVGFIQNRVLTLSRNLSAGDADFVVPRQWLAPAELPRRIYVLVDGLLQAEIDFTVPEDVAQRVTPEGDLRLLPMTLEPGRVVVEVESHQFDGSIERRTVPIQIPERVLLDTP